MYELKYQQIDRQTDTNTRRQTRVLNSSGSDKGTLRRKGSVVFAVTSLQNIISRMNIGVDKKLLYVWFVLKKASIAYF